MATFNVDVNMLPLKQASLCVDCSTVSDATSDVCPACGAQGALLSIARLLDPKVTRVTVEA